MGTSAEDLLHHKGAFHTHLGTKLGNYPIQTK